ncbi:hypothetical protein FZW96_14505 [Bacillus sp. BGMRC 2118]|nr:hypothetical protein FZW96_14505 [Bacillus sp. BGMRC 2118]
MKTEGRFFCFQKKQENRPCASEESDITMNTPINMKYFGISIALIFVVSLVSTLLPYSKYYDKSKTEELQALEQQVDQVETVLPSESSFPREEDFPAEMNDYEVQNAIHYMSHQKVYAEEKWGAIQITPERIRNLVASVEQYKLSLKHGDLYLDILTRWSEGDFSKADHDHNEIWKLQNGTVGEATRVLSEREEQTFIERNFD